MSNHENRLLQEVIKAKESYRKVFRAKTWEEKVQSIRRMQVSDQLAKEGMRKTLAERKAKHP